jgi:hypothetical protein
MLLVQYFRALIWELVTLWIIWGNFYRSLRWFSAFLATIILLAERHKSSRKAQVVKHVRKFIGLNFCLPWPYSLYYFVLRSLDLCSWCSASLGWWEVLSHGSVIGRIGSKTSIQFLYFFYLNQFFLPEHGYYSHCWIIDSGYYFGDIMF